MAETTKEKWGFYSDAMRKSLSNGVKTGTTSVSFSGSTEHEAMKLFVSPYSPFDSAVYADGDIHQVPTCYVLSDETVAHIHSIK